MIPREAALAFRLASAAADFREPGVQPYC